MKKVTKPSLDQLDVMADWMDNKFRIPGTQIRFGLDALIGLIPGIGDTVTLASTAYLIGVARSYELPTILMIKMIWNAFLDWLIGLIPLVGDLFDIGWKANRRNVAIIRDYVERHSQSGRRAAA